MSAIACGIIIFAYLCGSVSSAILVCRIARLPDPRKYGSKNPGVTNVLRIGGRLTAASVLLLDILKGTLPVWLAYKLNITPLYVGLTAIVACLGHIYPIFFHFHGGKGVATALGAVAPIHWDLVGLLISVWLLTILLTGYSSLGSIVSAIISLFYVWWTKPQLTFPVATLACLILIRHQDNIRRLWRGKERKIWGKILKKKCDIKKNNNGQDD
ncbi:glycerol-3-phosphate 1-O-acyltransferase PlsY [Candidatus Gillettellia adelgis]